jgi:hypothetical protein
MAEQAADRRQASTFSLELDRMCVAKGMGVDSLVDAGSASETRKEVADVAGVNLTTIKGAD